ncbi:hypothetical protein [Fibrella musci]|uniref:hypothetical protein n=1 Tax=Fibrella musci TaxID=3242485 RepID=UPI00351FE9D8
MSTKEAIVDFAPVKRFAAPFVQINAVSEVPGFIVGLALLPANDHDWIRSF